MGKTGWIDSQQNTFRPGSRNVGKRPGMNGCASLIITVSFGGTFAMKNDNNNEGIALLFAIALMITLTMGLNAFVQLIL